MCPTNLGACSAIVGAPDGRSIVLVMAVFLSAGGAVIVDPPTV
jgi:hypothetical protein